MPTTTVEMYQPGHNVWTTMTRTLDGYWQFPADDTGIDQPIQRPITLKLHAPNGEVMYDDVNPQSMGESQLNHVRLNP